MQVKRIADYTNDELVADGGFAERRVKALLLALQTINLKQQELGLDPYYPDTYLGDMGDLGLASAYIPPDAMDCPFAGFSNMPDSPTRPIRKITEALHAMAALKAAGSTVSMQMTGTQDRSGVVGTDDILEQTTSSANPISSSGYASTRPSGEMSVASGDYYGFNSIQGRNVALVPVAIRKGDTLPTLAAKHLGHRRYYRLLAMINHLNPPYIDSVSARDRGVLGCGDSLLVPKSSAGTTTEASGLFGESADGVIKGGALFPKTNAITDSDRFFGIDLYFDWATHDVKVSQAGDLMPALRESQVNQFLTIIVEVEKGSYSIAPTFGAMKRPGFKNTRINVAYAEMDFRNSLARDPRIREVVNVQAVVLDNSLVAVAQVLLERINRIATLSASRSLL